MTWNVEYTDMTGLDEKFFYVRYFYEVTSFNVTLQWGKIREM